MLLLKSTMQPGVADPEMERLVNEKVEAFWKGMESGAHNKRGQVSIPRVSLYLVTGTRMVDCRCASLILPNNRRSRG